MQTNGTKANVAAKITGSLARGVEKKQPKKKKDILLIPRITKEFDNVSLAKEKSEGRDVLIYSKKIGDQYFYYETIGGKKNKTLQPKTFYKRKAK